MTITQPTNQPTNKVAAGAVSGALTLLGVYLFGVFGVQIPAEVAAAATTIISFVVSYYVKESV